jgi:hypothetical protein
MAFGFILQYQAQQSVVGALIERSPVWLLYDPGLVVCWWLGLVPLVQNDPRIMEFYWKFFFWVVIVVIVVFDLRVILGLAKGLRIPIFKLPRRH